MILSRRKVLSSLAIATVSVAVVPLTGCPSKSQVQSWIATAEADAPVVKQVLDSILAIAAEATGNSLIAPGVQVILNGSISLAEAGLAAVATLVADYQATANMSVLAKLDASLVDLQTNLSAILSIDPTIPAAIKTAIATGVGLAITVVSSLQLLIPSANASSKAVFGGSTTLPVAIPTPIQIRNQYNAMLVVHGFAAHKI